MAMLNNQMVDINRPLYIGDYRYVDIFDFLNLFHKMK